MKIVYLIHSLHASGGMERVLSIKASYLAGLPDCSVHIITASLRGRKPFFPLSDKVIVTDLGTGDSFFKLPKYRRRLSLLLEHIRPDICISLGGPETVVLPSLKDGSVKMAEFHFSHDKFLLKYGSYPLGRLYASLRIRSFEKAAAKLERLVVLTKEDEAVWGSVLNNVTAISNPVTLPEAEGSPVAPLKDKSVIAVGRLCPQKDYPSMIRSWSKVALRHPDWTLDIYGAGPLEKEIAALISDCGLSGSVRLMGVSTDIRSRMLEHSAILMSSAYEGFPLALVEASSCGLPLISFDCSRGPSEIITDGENGFLVARGDEDGLADAVCRIIEDETLRLSMGRKSLESSSRFRISAIMSHWTALFEELAGPRCGSAS